MSKGSDPPGARGPHKSGLWPHPRGPGVCRAESGKADPLVGLSCDGCVRPLLPHTPDSESANPNPKLCVGGTTGRLCGETETDWRGDVYSLGD